MNAANDAIESEPPHRSARLRGAGPRAALAFASGVLAALARPPADIGPLACVALVGLLVVWRDDSPRGAFGHGLLAGAGYFGVVVSWVWYFGAVAIVPFVAVLALSWGLVGATVAWLRRHGLAAPWLTGAVWILSEGLLARWPFGGFSWGELGYSMHDISPVRALAALGGLPLVSFAVVATNALLADLLVAPVARARTRAALGLAGVIGTVAVWTAVPTGTHPSARVHFALVQGNDKNRDLTDAELADRYLPRSNFRLAAKLDGRYDLVVFPESSMDMDPREDPWLTSTLRATARRLDAYVLANGVGDAPDGRAVNQNVLYDPAGRVVATYSKRHLVPFGEWVPWRATLEQWISALHRIPRDFKPGTHDGAATLQVGDRAVGIAQVICFESAFGYQVRPLVHDGASLLVVSTNNRSYRRSANSWQHVAIGQLRAAETGRPVLQASISGHSAVIDAGGDLVAHTALFRNGVLTGRVVTRTGLTPYVRFGEWVSLAAIAALLAASGVALGRARRSRRRAARSVDSPDASTPVGAREPAASASATDAH